MVDIKVTGVNVEQRPLSEKTLGRIADGVQKYSGARRRGPGTKGYWLTVWAMKASSRGVPMDEIKKTMARMRKKSIAEILKFIKTDAVTSSDTVGR